MCIFSYVMKCERRLHGSCWWVGSPVWRQVCSTVNRCAGRLLLRHREHRRLQQLQDLPPRSEAQRERLFPILQGESPIRLRSVSSDPCREGLLRSTKQTVFFRRWTWSVRVRSGPTTAIAPSETVTSSRVQRSEVNTDRSSVIEILFECLLIFRIWI